MRRTGDRILVDARRRREEARDEIVGRAARRARDDDAAHRQRSKALHVGCARLHVVFGIDLNEVIVTASPHETRRDAEGVGEPGRRRTLLGGRRGEIEDEILTVASRDENTALRVEAHFAPARDSARFLEDVRARESCVSAQFDLDGRREPSQIEFLAARHDERRLRKIHFTGDVLHPPLARGAGEQTHGSWVAAKRRGSECVDGKKRNAHTGSPRSKKRSFGGARQERRFFAARRISRFHLR